MRNDVTVYLNWPGPLYPPAAKPEMISPKTWQRRTRLPKVPSLFASELPEWIDDGLCVGLDPEAWFPRQGQTELAQLAKRICDACPVIAECAEYGLDEKHGIWGGTTPLQRRRLGRGRGRRGIDYDIEDES